MQVLASGLSDIGLKRPGNEDALLLASVAATLPDPLPDNAALACPVSGAGLLLAVSDGIGGCNAGEVASAIALATLHHDLAASSASAADAATLLACLYSVDDAIRAAADLHAERQGMGATLTALWLHPAGAWLAQVGDSRLYRWRADDLRQLSPEHSPVGRMRQSGQLTEDQARRHRYKHVIDQSLGGPPAAFAPEVLALDLLPGDVVLLCSDGLTDGLADAELVPALRAVAAGQTSPAAAAAALVEAAKIASGRDNITVLVAVLA